MNWLGNGTHLHRRISHSIGDLWRLKGRRDLTQHLGMARIVAGTLALLCAACTSRPAPPTIGGATDPARPSAPGGEVSSENDAQGADTHATGTVAHRPAADRDAATEGLNPLPHSLVPMECPALNTPRSSCEPSSSWLTHLAVEASALLAPTHWLPEKDVCDRAASALRDALQEPAGSLHVHERVVGQNLAMQVLASRGCRGSSQEQELSSLARRVALHLAMNPQDLRALAGEPFSHLDDWVGPRPQWRVLRSRNVPLFHETSQQYTRRFSAVRTDSTRAIFSQIVAFDTQGTPFITELVGRLEMRSGLNDDAPACVAKLDLTQLQCAQLRPVTPPEDLNAQSISFFLHFATGNTVTCGECHGAKSARAANPEDTLFGDLNPVEEAERDAHLEARSRAFKKGALLLGQRLR